jgi:predicted nicotinamide N-methyase
VRVVLRHRCRRPQRTHTRSTSNGPAQGDPRTSMAHRWWPPWRRWSRPEDEREGGSAKTVSLHLPSGRELRVRTELEAKRQGDATIEEAASTARQEGADLGGWTGGSVWESSRILARVLIAMQAELVAGRRVIELGAGCGLPGLTAGALGASCCHITDNVTFMAQANIDCNFEAEDADARCRIRATR